MNRRAFFRRVGTGVVGALVLAHVPAAVIDRLGLHELSRVRIREQMRQIYNEHARGRSLGDPPRVIEMGEDAYMTYESELLANERFMPASVDPKERCLKFKAATVRPVGRGWTMRIAA